MLSALKKIKQFFLTPSFSLVMLDAAFVIINIIGWHCTGNGMFTACGVYFLIMMASDTCMAWNYKKGNKDND